MTTPSDDGRRMTVQDFVGLLMEASEQVGGLTAPIELAICDGHDQQFIENVQVTWQHAVDEEGKVVIPSRDMFVLILGHWHRGESPGRIQHGVATDVDEELREMIEGGG